jgi:hypothetical protein
MKQNFLMVHFLGALLRERIVLNFLKRRNLWPAHKYSMERRKEVLLLTLTWACPFLHNFNLCIPIAIIGVQQKLILFLFYSNPYLNTSFAFLAMSSSDMIPLLMDVSSERSMPEVKIFPLPERTIARQSSSQLRRRKARPTSLKSSY